MLLGVCLHVCVPLCVCVCLCACVPLSLNFSFSLCLSVCLSLSLRLCVCVCLLACLTTAHCGWQQNMLFWYRTPVVDSAAAPSLGSVCLDSCKEVILGADKRLTSICWPLV